MSANRADFSITVMARVLGVSKARHYGLGRLLALGATLTARAPVTLPDLAFKLPMVTDTPGPNI